MTEVLFDVATGDLLLPKFIAATNPSKEELGAATRGALIAIHGNPERHCNEFWMLTFLALATYRAQQGRFCTASPSQPPAVQGEAENSQ